MKKAGIIFLYQLFEKDILLPFNVLKDNFQLLNNNFFQNLQIRHALQSQTSKLQLQYNPSEILLKATSVQSTKRGLIGNLYLILQTAESTERQVVLPIGKRL